MTVDVTRHFKTPTAFVGPPNVQQIALLHSELGANAASIPTTLGNGFGLIVLIFTASEFATATNNHVFQYPVQPPTHAILLPGATGPQIAESNRRNDHDRVQWNIFREAEIALKNSFFEVVDKIYTSELAHPTLGYATVTCRQLLALLRRKYGKASSADYTSNLARMDIDIDFELPIEHFFQRIDNGIAFTKIAGDEMTTESALRLAIIVIQRSGQLSEGVMDWEMRTAPATLTMDSFRTLFTRHFKYRQSNKTAGNQGFANAARQPPPNPGRPPRNGNATSQAIVSYCWTHGKLTNAGHDSSNCTRKREGHKDAATLTNMMGGTSTNYVPWNRRGERE
jgi:hypothetical protein